MYKLALLPFLNNHMACYILVVQNSLLRGGGKKTERKHNPFPFSEIEKKNQAFLALTERGELNDVTYSLIVQAFYGSMEIIWNVGMLKLLEVTSVVDFGSCESDRSFKIGGIADGLGERDRIISHFTE